MYPLNAREIGAIIAVIAGIGIAAIATERRQQPLMLPVFGKPICPIDQPLAEKTSVEI